MMRTVALSIVILTALLFCLRSGFVGLLTWTWFSVMMPQAEAWVPTILYRINLIAGVLTVLAIVMAKDRKFPPINIFVILLSFLSVIIVLSQVFSLNRELSFDQFNRGAETMFATLAILILANTKVKIQSLLWVFILSLGYYGTTRGLYTIASGGAPGLTGPAATIIKDNNHLAVAIASAIPLSYYLIRTSLDIRARLLALSVSALGIVAVIGTNSRGGLISLGVLGIGFFMRSKQKLFSVILAGVVTVGVLLFMPPSWFSRMDTISSADKDSSFMGRVEAWEVAYRIGLQYPLLGIGAQLHYLPEYNFRVVPIVTVSGEPYQKRATHNAYLEILAGNGFPALGAFLAMMATTYFWSNKIIKLTKDVPLLFWANELASMLQLSLLVFAVGAMALSMEYWFGFWLTMALTVNLREIVLRDLKEKRIALT